MMGCEHCLPSKSTPRTISEWSAISGVGWGGFGRTNNHAKWRYNQGCFHVTGYKEGQTSRFGAVGRTGEEFAESRSEDVLKHWRYVVSVVAAGALIGILASNALAGSASNARTGARAGTQTFSGNVTVNGNLHADKNLSANGPMYAHKGVQVLSGNLMIKKGDLAVPAAGLNVTGGGLNIATGGLTVNGGTKSDSLVVTNAVSVGGNATVTGNLQTGAATATSLNVTGAATVGTTLNAAGKITGSGLDAGTGAITTTGTVSAGQITATTIVGTGTLTATNLTVAGNVNFTNAHITGLDLTGATLNGATFLSLTVGNATAAVSPLFVTANGKTAAIGVNSTGAVTVDSLFVNAGLQANGSGSILGSLSVGGNATVGGTLTVSNAAGITTSNITAPSPSSTLGPLTLVGSTIGLTGGVNVNGPLTLSTSSNLILTGTSGSASHIVAASTDPDVAGIVTVNVGAVAVTPWIANGVSPTVSFKMPYAAAPTVVLTAVGDPNPNGPIAPKVWVTSSASGFTVNYQSQDAATAAAATTVQFYYHVIG
jgi:hypothetical protein